MLFFDRQWLLEVLYDQLQHKDRVLLQSRVKTIVPLEAGASVVTTGGRTFTGDIVVGADGIHSAIRHEMRRLADELRPGFMPSGEEGRVTCYYRCLFGISVDVENWPDDDQTFTNGRGASFLVASGPHKRVYWFCFARLPKKRCGKEIPRYTKEDEARFVEEHGHRAITESVTFGDIYTKRISSTLTPLHEVVFDKWGFERIVLIGDSAHKVCPIPLPVYIMGAAGMLIVVQPNPISGAGGNAAIETAAEFVNALLRLRDRRPDGLVSGLLTTSEVETVSQEMQKARVKRVKGLVKAAHSMQALFAYEKPLVSDMFHVVLPLLGADFSLEQLASRFVGGPRLQHLPVPARPRAIPFDHELPARPLGKRFTKRTRTLFVVLMGLVAILAPRTASPQRPCLEPRSSGECLGVPAWTTSAMAQMLFAGFIYSIECFRVGHQGTLLGVFPGLVAIMPLKGLNMGDAVPLFAILSAFQSFRRSSGRPIDPNSLKMALPIDPELLPLALVVVCALPVILCLSPGDLWVSWLECLPLALQVFPSTTVLLCVQSWRCLDHSEPAATDPKRFDQYKNGDVPKLLAMYWYFFSVQAGSHIAAVAYSYLSLQRDAWSSVQSVFEALPPSVWIGITGHCLYSIWELRCLGFVTSRKAGCAALAVVLGQALVGPGAIWAATWVWREATIARLSTLDRLVESSDSSGGEPKAR